MNKGGMIVMCVGAFISPGLEMAGVIASHGWVVDGIRTVILSTIGAVTAFYVQRFLKRRHEDSGKV